MKAGKIAKKALEKGKKTCKVGTPYFDVVKEIEQIILDEGAKPAFPVNVSVNEVGAHYTPYPGDGKVFRKGDVIKIDVGCHVDGYIADTATTVELDSEKYSAMIETAEDALMAGLKIIRPGIRTKEIGQTIESIIQSRGYNPIKNLTGHAIERNELHAGVSIPNIGRGRDRIEKGMILAVEPFVTDGKGKVVNGEKSQIYHLRGRRNLSGEDKNFYEWLEKRFDNLPFASYWCRGYDKEYFKRLNRLERFGSIMSYPVLVEAKNGMITQREHTVIVTSKGVKAITA